MRYKKSLLSILFLAAGTSCSKFVDTPLPVNSITANNAFSSDASAISTLLGAYGSIENVASSFSLDADLFSDDVYYTNATASTEQAQDNTYDPTVDYQFFTNYYKAIYNANAIIEAMASPGSLTDTVVSGVLGESKFLRAYCYFQLTNLYGSVPLVLTTDATVSALLPNTPEGQSYQAIIQDLRAADSLLPATYPSASRVRANKWVASALLAKVYLYAKDWSDAAALATQVINSGGYTLQTDLNTVFLSGSNETIWQIWNQNGYTSVGSTYLPTTATVYYSARYGLEHAFEPGDLRMAGWLKAGTGGSDTLYYPYKYKQRTAATGANAEYLVQLRLAEQYLIRAEARAQLGDITNGLADLNVIRKRAGLTPATAADQEDLLLKVEQERRVELFAEAGNRWFDLNRTGRTAYWLAPQKPTWQDRDTVLPYPTTILLANPNLRQNPGY